MSLLRFFSLSRALGTAVLGLAMPQALAVLPPSEVTVGLDYVSSGVYRVDVQFLDRSFDETNNLLQGKLSTAALWTNLSYLPTQNYTGMYEQASSSFNWTTAPGNYQFRVVALKGSSVQFSPIVAAGTADLGTPTLKLCQAVGPFTVRMNWEENSIREDEFIVEYKEPAATTWSAHTPRATITNGTYNVSEVFNHGGTYQFRVTAKKAAVGNVPAAFSAPSNVITVTLPRMPLPTNLRAVTITDTAVSFAWTDNAPYEMGSALRYRDKDNIFGTWDILWQAPYPDALTTDGLVPGFEPGKKYEVSVTQYITFASLGALISDWTAPITITTKNGVNSAPGIGASVNAPFSHTFSTTTLGATITSSSVTGKPAWMTYDETTHTLTGTPTNTGVTQLTFNAQMSDGWPVTQQFYVRTRWAKGAPLLTSNIGNQELSVGGSRSFALNNVFFDPETTQVMRMRVTGFPNADSAPRNVDMILYPDVTPATVTNFMSYVNSGKFADTLFHRSVAGFVVQGGGFRFQSDAAGSAPVWTKVETAAPVVNEPGLPNVRGSLAMAKIDGDPNSATNQFFASTSDNSRTTSSYPKGLDFQNGGFTVFGRIADKDMSTITAINSQPVLSNLNVTLGAESTSFGGVPYNTPTAGVLPDPATAANFVRIESITPVTDLLTYTVSGNTDGAVAVATVVNNQLTVQALSSGNTTITVQAADADGQLTTHSFLLTVPQPAGQGVNESQLTAAELLPYAITGNPAAQLGQPLAIVRGLDNRLHVSFDRWDATQNIILSVEASTDASAPQWEQIWNSTQGNLSPAVVEATDNGDRTHYTIRDTQAIGTTTRRFLRVKATLP